MIQVALLDSQIPLMDQIAGLLNRQTDIICNITASGIGEFFESISTDLEIDVLLSAISMGSYNSLDHLEKIRRILPECKIIIFTAHTEPDLLLTALEKGAHSFVSKSCNPDLLPDIIRTTHEGGAYLEPTLVPYLLDRLKYPYSSIQTGLFRVAAPFRHLSTTPPKDWKLNAREKQVLEGLVEGKSYKEIGQQCNIGLNTVRVYIKSLYGKLNVHNKAALINRWNNAQRVRWEGNA